MNDLYEALEICLQELEQGADLETVLFRHPDLADELRPILEGAIHARSMAIMAPSAEMVRRNRSKVLQHAAQMREAKARPSRRVWFVSLRRIAVTLAVVLALFVSGTGLVRAASATLPGDNLYPVKRTWEDVLLLFTFNLQQREALELEHENERLQELIKVFAEGRSTEVEFSGMVTSQTGNEWIVNGVRVIVSSQTELRDGPIAIGSAVRVKGWTQEKGMVLAERVRLLSPEDKLPDIEYEHEGEEHNDNEGPGQQVEDNSGPGSGNENSNVEETETPESDNSNSGSHEDSNTNDQLNDNGGAGKDQNNNSGSDEDNSGSGNSNDDNKDNSNDDNQNNDNGDDSGGGGDNSGSGGGGGGDD